MQKSSNDVIVFELRDKTGRLLANYGDISALPAVFSEKATENFSEGSLRNIYRENEIGSIRVVSNKESSLFPGTRGATRACSVYLSMIPHFRRIENAHRQRFDAVIKRFAHNLIKFQTRFKGNFATLMSDKARSRPFAEFQEEVKRRIDENTLIAARDVCQMSHRAVDLDAQIEALRVISGYATKPKPEDMTRVDLRKTIFRLTNPFVEELKNRNVSIDSKVPAIISGDDKVLVDPGLLNVVIWQLFDNASKYAKNDSIIEITADLINKQQKLEISMVSVCIDQDELGQVFLEGRKGRHAGSKGESGIGLFIVKKALTLMRADVAVSNEGTVCQIEKFPYCKQQFTITFAPR